MMEQLKSKYQTDYNFIIFSINEMKTVNQSKYYTFFLLRVW